VRHARSRRAEGLNRKPNKRPIKLDLQFHAAKISEWEQESLAEEEVAPTKRANSGSYMSTVRRRIVPGNPAELDQGRTEASGQPATEGEGRCENEQESVAKEEVVPPEQAHSGTLSTGRRRSLLNTLSDLDQGPKEVGGERDTEGGAPCENENPNEDSSLGDGKEHNRPSDVVCKVGSPNSLPDMEWSTGESPLVEILEFSGKGNDTQNLLQLQRSVPQECLPVISATPVSKPVQRNPVTSPTPPSNPLAVYMALRGMEGECRQRRLDFMGSPASAKTGAREQQEQQVDFWEVESAKDLCREMDQIITTSKEGLQDFTPHNAADENLVDETEIAPDVNIDASLALVPEPTIEVQKNGGTLLFLYLTLYISSPTMTTATVTLFVLTTLTAFLYRVS
jgi:hypothetical protein